MCGYTILFGISIVISIIALVKDRIANYIFKPNLLLQKVDDMPTYEEKNTTESQNQEQSFQDDNNKQSDVYEYVPWNYKNSAIPSFPEASTTNSTLFTNTYINNKNQDTKLGKLKLYYQRIRIVNKPVLGAIQAQGVYGRILSIRKDGKKLDKFNSILMRWVTNNFFETLSVGEYLMLNLCTAVYKYKDNKVTVYDYYLLPGHTGGLHYGLAAGFDIDQFKGNGKYIYEIGIYGKNYKGSKYTIEIDFKDDNGKPYMDISCHKLDDILNVEENCN